MWAECLFADPIADIAVLGTRDTQDLSEQADAYEALVESVKPLAVHRRASRLRHPVRRDVPSIRGQFRGRRAAFRGPRRRALTQDYAALITEVQWVICVGRALSADTFLYEPHLPQRILSLM